MGNFGSHKWLYPDYLLDKYEERVLRPRQEENPTAIAGYSGDTVWVNKRYIPTDLRATGMASPPAMVRQKQSRFPHINSPMTRYTDDMHLTNRLFKLH
jgi:hypothetical protein